MDRRARFLPVVLDDYLETDEIDSASTSRQTQSSTDSSQEQLISLYWRPSQSSSGRVFVFKVKQDTSRCCVCNNPSRKERLQLLVYDRWALIENDKLWLKSATDSHFLCALCFTDGITEHCRTNAQMNGGRLQRINQDEKLKIAQDLPQVFTREMKETCEGFHVSEELTSKVHQNP